MIQRLVVILVCVVLGCALAGCDRSAPPQTAAEIKHSLAKVFAEGVEYDRFWVRAESGFDPISFELRDLRLSGKDVELFARRGRIEVDVERQEMSIVLTEVVTAATGEGGADGRVQSFESRTVGPVSLDGYLSR